MNTPLKWHGGKAPLARRIVDLMPTTGVTHYVEPFAGGLSVLLARDPEDVSEVANDLDGGLMNFWRTLQDPERFTALQRRLEATPFSEMEWNEATDPLDAAAFFVRCRQSLAGRRDSFSPLSRNRTRRGMNEQTSAWLTAIDGLPTVHARLRRVVVLNRPALDVVRSQDGDATLFYLDPPYLATTRTAPDVYMCEMDAAKHVALLDALGSLRGRFLLSGYRSPMYDAAAQLHGWRRVDFDVANHAASGEGKRRMTECIWMNYT